MALGGLEKAMARAQGSRNAVGAAASRRVGSTSSVKVCSSGQAVFGMGLKIQQLVTFCKRIQKTSHLPRREELGGAYEKPLREGMVDSHPSEAETEQKM